MHSKAFTLFELAITIFLAGLLGSVGYFYLNTSLLKKYQYETTIQSHINLLESMIFQCKSLSEQFPLKLNLSTKAVNTLVTELECNTSISYMLNGGKNGFVPIPPTGFSQYRATESGNEFYISTSADNNSTEAQALQNLSSNYTSQQAMIEYNTTSTILKFYLSR